MFQNKYSDFFQLLGDHQQMVLSTCSEGHVTARTISFIIRNHTLLFQTDQTSEKSVQIQNNPIVAVCMDNIQIEGTCSQIGHPFNLSNRFFLELYKAYFTTAFERYSHLPNECVYQINPSKITLWKYDKGQPYREVFNVLNADYQILYY